MPQRLFPAALTTNPNVPTSVKCAFNVEPSEIDTMEQIAPQLAANLSLQSAGLNFAKPTTLSDSNHVKLRQLQRRCLENYLLDPEIITDLTRDKDFANEPLRNVTDTTAIMKKLALSQLDHVSARSVFKQLGLETVGFDFKVLNNADPTIIASSLWSRIESIRESFDKLGTLGFGAEFKKQFDCKRNELSQVWDEKWRDLCDGKLLFQSLRSGGHVRGDLLKLKRRIAVEMRVRTTETWSALDNHRLS